jgi:ABC-2 type transport system ATP-binding protein
VRQCLTYAAWCHNTDSAEKVEAIAQQVGLTDFLDKNAGILSRGYRQRLGIGLALIHDPKVLLLDEPASGMDPEARIALSGLMKNLRDQGKTIIVSSHILNELEDYCTDMLVIRNGRISDCIRLKEHSAKNVHLLRIGTTGDAAGHLARIQALPQVSNARIENGQIICDFDGDEKAQQQLLGSILTAGIPVFSISRDAHTLQDAYMDIAAGRKGK